MSQSRLPDEPVCYDINVVLLPTILPSMIIHSTPRESRIFQRRGQRFKLGSSIHADEHGRRRRALRQHDLVAVQEHFARLPERRRIVATAGSMIILADLLAGGVE